MLQRKIYGITYKVGHIPTLLRMSLVYELFAGENGEPLWPFLRGLSFHAPSKRGGAWYEQFLLPNPNCTIKTCNL